MPKVKKAVFWPMAILSVAMLAAGCASPNFAFNIGEPEHYRLDRGKEGSILITRQKKMSFGFLPSTAEERRRPPESITPIIGWDHATYIKEGQFTRDSREPLARYMLFGLFATPWSLLVTPWHGDYSCDSHYWTDGNVGMLALFPQDVRNKIHAKTYKDGDRDWGAIRTIGHASLLGFHRYATVVIEELDEGEVDSIYETK